MGSINLGPIIPTLLSKAAGLLVIVWLIFEISLMIFRKGNLYPGNFFSNILVSFSFFLYLLLAFLLNRGKLGIIRNHSLMLNILGIMFILGGFVLRVISLIKLGKWFTPNVTVRSNQAFVQDGIYRLIRHPSYCGGIGIYCGISMVLGNWILLIFSLTWFLLVYSLRIRAEEKILIEKFGQDYFAYRKKTRRFIPFIY